MYQSKIALVKVKNNTKAIRILQPNHAGLLGSIVASFYLMMN
ncbi:hypothetical protein C8J23_1632 [Shewanella chilikensis]|uniref:Uncharacterized protein n=1 Tax=Shewanella chilikensis TaxID=558541 RepID=A0ABX5PHG2_9GAMM|nr:hypothetical protein [Shewanella chilikensis]PYE53444.1 hypothetical protein C8J23_1632 [Shewanella chilikensis]